jgi:hypothetical protein
MTTKITTIAALAGVLAIGAGAAPAQAMFGYKAATYKVEVQGVQTNAWKTDHVKSGMCDANMKGEGTEVVRFHSKPKLVRAFTFTGSRPTFMGSGKKFNNYIDLVSKITRRGSMNVSNDGEACANGGGAPSTPNPPDCGTKYSTAYAELNYSSTKRDFLTLEQTIPALGPFRNCVSGSGSWPALLTSTLKRGDVGQRLPQRDLFGPNRLHIVRAAAREEATSGDHWHQTTIQYTIKLTRIDKVQG